MEGPCNHPWWMLVQRGMMVPAVCMECGIGWERAHALGWSPGKWVLAEGDMVVEAVCSDGQLLSYTERRGPEHEPDDNELA